MSQPPQEHESTSRLRLFLVGVRLVGVITAVLLTNFHRDGMVEEWSDYGAYITGGVVLYHLLAGVLSYGVTGVLAGLLVMVDVAVGVYLTYLFAEPYFLLVFTLPVMELAAFFSNLAAFFAAFLGIIFYVIIYAFPFLQQIEAGQTGAIIWRLQLIGVQGALSVLLIWLYSLAVAEGKKRSELLEKAHEEKHLLYQEIQTKTAEVGKIYGEVGDREARVLDMESSIQTLRDELEAAYRDLAEAKLSSNRIESMMEETQVRMAEELHREKDSLERQASRIKRKLEQKIRLVEIFKQIVGNLKLEDTLLALVFQLQSLFPSKSCVIFMLDEVDGHRELFPEVADTPHTDYFRNLVLQIGEEAPGWVFVHRKAVKIDNGSMVFEGAELSTLPGQGMSAMVAPLATRESHGVIYLGREEPEAYSPEDLDMLEEFCELASLVVANSLDFKNTISRGLHDKITGLYNGLYLEERMREEVRRGRRYTYPVALLLLDIDGFHQVSNVLSEEQLGGVLREIAEVIRAATRETDVPARLEGDDFGVLLVHSDRDNAFVIGERIRAEVGSREFGSGRHRVQLTASIGVAGVPHDATNEEQLRLRAHAALQHARSQGGNLTACFTP